MDRTRVIRELYSFVENHRFPNFLPPDYDRVRGRIDLHVHTGPSRQDPYVLGQHASRAGVRALVLKSPFLGPSVELARVLNGALADWAATAGFAPTELLGSIVLSPDTGGIRPEYVEKFVAAGARVVWFPVIQAANHLERAKGLPADAARQQGISVLDGDRLKPAAEEVLDIVHQSGVGLSFGHLSKAEMFALADGCRRRGITRAFVDHPFSPVANFTVDEMVEIAQQGITINFTYWELSPYCGVTALEMMDAVRRIGPARVTISSDSSMEIFPDSVECMRLHAAMLDLYQFTPDEQHQMLAGNQAHILGLDA